MNSSDGIDVADVISKKQIEKIVKAHKRHGKVELYDDVGSKDLKEKSVTRRVRKADDKHLWDMMEGEREWAWKVIVTACAMQSNGLGFGVVNLMRTSRGVDGDLERGAMTLAMFSEWRILALSRGLNPELCIDLLWRGLSFRDVNRKYRHRHHATRLHVTGCLDLLIKMRADAKPQEWLKAWQAKGDERCVADGICSPAKRDS